MTSSASGAGPQQPRPSSRAWRVAPFILACAAVAVLSNEDAPDAAIAQAAVPQMPAPPANGEIGFVVSGLRPAIQNEKDDCPDGLTPMLKDVFLATLPPAERMRLLEKSNEGEFDKRWKAYALGPNNTNICSQPELFDRPAQTVYAGGRRAPGLNLDDDSGDGASQGCAHGNFASASGERGIDNQVWRVMGCTRNWRGVDGTGGDSARGFKQFLISGEWTQVMLLRGVDSLVNDDSVELIYANTEDRAVVDTAQNFLPGASFTISDNPQHRNVLQARIVNGVLTTAPARVRLRQTWGQGGNRDIRGQRTEFDFRRAKLRLTFNPDGSVKGMIGGYQPLWSVIQSPSIGGIGAATTAGYDCAGIYAALKKLADGDRDPKTGQCTTISTAMEIEAVPAFVNDRAPTIQAAAK